MSAQDIESVMKTDADGNPAGGRTYSVGMDIIWQNGPLGTGEDRVLPNGAFVETVIEAAINRLEFYQDSKFQCMENALAIFHLRQALDCLQARTAGREAAGVEGTHELGGVTPLVSDDCTCGLIRNTDHAPNPRADGRGNAHYFDGRPCDKSQPRDPNRI